MAREIIVGFDDGDGNASVYTSVVQNGGDPTPIKALPEDREVSVYAVFEDESYSWGTPLRDMSADDLLNVKRFMVNFKAIPGTGNDTYMQEFAAMVCDAVKAYTNNFNGLTPVWYIGCPSSWHQQDSTLKEKYAEIFRKAGLGDVEICEESTAALAYYDRALKVVTKENVSCGVLLIDWGSSTLDATFIYPPKNGEKRIEACGCALGAHYIDKAIVYALLYTPEKYGLETLQDQPLIAKVRTEYERSDVFRRMLHFHARILKESYFKAIMRPGMKPKASQIKWTETVHLSDEAGRWGEGASFFRLGVSINMMNDLLHAPLRDVVPDFDDYNDFTRDDLGDHSFVSRNDSFLQKLAEQYADFAESEDALIVLTGGASQMDFVRDAVSRYFPNHQIDYDTDPELTIARGLVYYGREALNNGEFERDFDEIGDREISPDPLNGESVPQLFWTLWDCYTDLAWDVTAELQKQCAISLLKALAAWRNADIRCEEINEKAAQIYASWAQDELPGIKKNSKEKYTNDMRKRINDMYQELLKKYNIKATIFNGQVTPELMELLDSVFDKMAENDQEFLREFGRDSFSSLGNGPRFLRPGKFDLEGFQDELVKLTREWIDLEYKKFTTKEIMQAVLAHQYWQVKAELDSKKESMLFQLGLMQ